MHCMIVLLSLRYSMQVLCLGVLHAEETGFVLSTIWCFLTYNLYHDFYWYMTLYVFQIVAIQLFIKLSQNYLYLPFQQRIRRLLLFMMEIRIKIWYSINNLNFLVYGYSKWSKAQNSSNSYLSIEYSNNTILFIYASIKNSLVNSFKSKEIYCVNGFVQLFEL